MIPVEEALGHIFSICPRLEAEAVPLAHAAGRVLAADVVATRAQPPFHAAVMDGYAVKGTDVAVGRTFRVVGEVPAGVRFGGTVDAGEAVRIFTGAPMPEGTDHVVMQEDAVREGDRITLTEGLDPKPNVRPSGSDFAPGDRLKAPRLLSPADLALIAAMNVAELRVARRPVVAILATGDELVMPGDAPGPDQIIASNAFGLKALAEAAGAEVRLLPIARDTRESLSAAFALLDGVDLLLTVGGASVGDYDLVGDAAEAHGIERAFYKVAMRPGKPLMAGRTGDMAMIGLPGNPVSALVCGVIFVMPAIRAMQGLGHRPAPRETATLASDLAANGPREHYMRARMDAAGVAAMPSQDSALLTILSEANALIVRPPGDNARKAGEPVQIVRLWPRD